jgi:pseudouridine-5'-phosphate glycosidase
MFDAVRRAGALGALTAVVRGQARVGLDLSELTHFVEQEGIRKASSRDLPTTIAAKENAATTVSAMLAIGRHAGLSVFATGGIGGVHRGGPPVDESADLLELSRTPAVVVCSGAKSILDIPATVERLETLAVTVVGFGTDEFPAFYARSSGIRLSSTADEAAEVTRIYHAARKIGQSAAVLVVQPPPEAVAIPREELEQATNRALREATSLRVKGQPLTPFLLAALARETAGRSLTTNVALLEANARLAGEIAARLAADRSAGVAGGWEAT